MKITIVGGSGYAGAHLVTEAAARGHAVIAVSRSAPALGAEPDDSPAIASSSVQQGGAGGVGTVTYLAGDVLEGGLLARAVTGADAVVSALSPRGSLAGRTRDVLARLAGLSTEAGARFGVVGGAGSLLLSAAGPLAVETDAVPAPYKAEAREMADVLTDLRALGEETDWFYVSPAAGFGPWAPGTRTGIYRRGGDVLISDAQGRSLISGADLAHAVIDELETPEHRRQRFHVAY